MIAGMAGAAFRGGRAHADPGHRPVPTGAGYGGAAALPGMLNRKLQPRRRFQIKLEAT